MHYRVYTAAITLRVCTLVLFIVSALHYKCLFLAGTCTGVPTGRLEEVVSDEDVATIARKHLTDWESLKSYLSRQQQVEICKSYISTLKILGSF